MNTRDVRSLTAAIVPKICLQQKLWQAFLNDVRPDFLRRPTQYLLYDFSSTSFEPSISLIRRFTAAR